MATRAPVSISMAIVTCLDRVTIAPRSSTCNVLQYSVIQGLCHVRPDLMHHQPSCTNRERPPIHGPEVSAELAEMTLVDCHIEHKVVDSVKFTAFGYISVLKFVTECHGLTVNVNAISM